MCSFIVGAVITGGGKGVNKVCQAFLDLPGRDRFLLLDGLGSIPLDSVHQSVIVDNILVSHHISTNLCWEPCFAFCTIHSDL